MHHGLITSPMPASSIGCGQEVQVHSLRDAQGQGIGMVYQHFTLVENMTVAENLVLSRADAAPGLSTGRSELKAIDAFMQNMPFRVRRIAPCGSSPRARSRSSRS